MNKPTLSLTLGLVAAAFVGSAGVAAERSEKGAVRHDGQAASTQSVESKATGGAVAPNARLAAVIDQGGGVVRSKGVAFVSNPGTGRYCIRPTNRTNIDVNTIVPSVTVDFSNSSFHESLAQYRSSGDGCPSGTIAVVTFADVNLDGRWGGSNTVAFTIVVP